MIQPHLIQAGFLGQYSIASDVHLKYISITVQSLLYNIYAEEKSLIYSFE